MADIRCKMCGGSVVLSADMEVSICDSCGTAAVLPEHIRQQLREERETREKKERAIAEAIAEQGIAEEQAKLKEQKEREEKELQRLIQHEYSRYPVLRFLGYLIVFALCAFLAVWLVFIITTGNNYDLSETL